MLRCIEDECNNKTEIGDNKSIQNSPNKGRTKTGSTTDMAVDQLQASEKLIAGLLHFSHIRNISRLRNAITHLFDFSRIK